MATALYKYLGPVTFIADDDSGTRFYKMLWPGRNVTLDAETPYAARLLSKNQIVAPSATGEIGPIISAISDQTITLNSGTFTLTPTLAQGAAAVWSAVGLPDDWAINTNTGRISGPTDTELTASIVLRAVNGGGEDTERFDVTIEQAVIIPPTIANINNIILNVGDPSFSLQPTLSSGSPATSWSATGLPAAWGINTSTGRITGPVTQEVTTRSIVITAVNSAGSDTETFTLTIEPAAPDVPVIGSIGEQVYIIGGPDFSIQPTSTGGSVDTWSATGLPAGFSINSSTGEITGSTGTPVSASVTVTASNAAGTDTETFTLNAEVPATPPVIQAIADLTLEIGDPVVSITPVLTSGSADSWSATGLPSGWSVNAVTGEITGAVTQEASTTITLTAVNTGGSDSEQIGVTITEPPPTAYDGLAAGAKIFMALSGQSNWRGHPIGTAYAGPLPTKTQVWDGSAFVLYTPDSNGYVTPMSPTLGLVLAFEDKYPDLTLYLAEHGRGGVGFQGGSGAFGDGNADRVALISEITGAIAALNAAPYDDYYIAGFSWWQGEKDAESSAHASAYQAQLTGLLADVDTAMGVTATKYITQIHTDTPGADAAAVATIRAAQSALADTLIDVDSFPTLADNLHFSAANYQAVGELYLERMEVVTPTLVDPAPPPPPTFDVDFTSLSALPTGWTLDDATATFGADGVTVTTTVTNNPQWEDAALRGPVIEWTYPVHFFFKGIQSQSAAGVSIEPTVWLSAGQHSLATIWNSFYQGNVNIKTYSESMENGGDYQMTLARSGADIVMTLLKDEGTGYVLQESHTVIGGFAGVDGAIAFIDPKTEPVTLSRIANANI